MGKKEKIYVSKKILADIGRGIYRTPANAIKELISNSFDACATWVKISTNYPYFDIFTCEDNGIGMTAEELQVIFKRIGSSSKRAGNKELIECEKIRRPIIGKIGIGLLAVSQICDRFTIISKKKNKKEILKASVDLRQFEEDDSYLSGKNKISLGEYELEIMNSPREEIPISFTRIIMDSLKKGFKSSLTEEHRKQIIRPKKYTDSILNFSEFVKKVSCLKNFNKLTIYDRMIWELGIFCPVRYLSIDNQIFPNNMINDDLVRLKEYKFRVLVDGLEIYKPIYFKQDNDIKEYGEDYKIHIIPLFDEEVAGQRLKFHGYFYSQRKKIIPNELQGIIIRIKDVAIGTYDRTILNYPREEGPRFGMVSGEIFVEKGLEGALNIDRNSFNEMHPHYIKLQSVIHNFFKDEVVKDIRERSKRRRKIEKKMRLKDELNRLTKMIKNEWGIDLNITVMEEPKEVPYIIDAKNNNITFFEKSSIWAKKSQKEKLLQMKFIVAIQLLRLSNYKTNPDDIITKVIL